jgi:eukaryotic-like serine/threonine-protein kinase
VSEKSIGPREGDVLAGKYRVDRILGAGGMGVVVAAHHLGLDTKVAVKLLLPEMLQHEDIVARFAREARSAAKITNEHVARVFDVGALEDGAPYLVMEFLDGTDLQQRLRADGAMAVEQAVDFVLQACEAVAEAHALGIVHRDLKPANLFCIDRAGASFIKVLDFGISKVTTLGGSVASHASMTRTSALMGTPFYMSPEQLESARDLDGRSDVWAFGIILFELISGQVPFGGTTLPEVCIKIATQPPPAIRDLRPDVPDALQTAILKCLSKNRRERFATVGELADALAPFAPPRSRDAVERLRRASRQAYALPETVSAPARPPYPPPAGPETLGALGHTHGGVTWLRTTRGKVLTGLGAFTAGGLVLAIVLLTSARPDTASTSPAALPRESAAGAPLASTPSPIATTATTLTPEDFGDGSVAALPIPPKVTPAAAEPATEGPWRDPRGASNARRTASPSPTSVGVSKPPASGRSPQGGATSRSPPTAADPATNSSAFDERL